MRKRLLAIHILTGRHRVNHDLLVPVVRHRYDNRVNLFVVEQFLVPARGRDGLADNFPCEFMAAIVKIASCRALDSRTAESLS